MVRSTEREPVHNSTAWRAWLAAPLVVDSVVVAENVSGLVKGIAKGYFLEILAALRSAGYDVEAKLLDAQWLGVPQARQDEIAAQVAGAIQIHAKIIGCEVLILAAVGRAAAAQVDPPHVRGVEVARADVFADDGAAGHVAARLHPAEVRPVGVVIRVGDGGGGADEGRWMKDETSARRVSLVFMCLGLGV